MARFPFRFATPYLVAGAPFGVTPATTSVDVTDAELRVRFGPWTVRTALDNVVGCTETGPFRFVKTVGPPRLSLKDRGLTCATNGDRGLCVQFEQPVPGIDPFGQIRHPAVTLTVARPDELAAALSDVSPR